MADKQPRKPITQDREIAALTTEEGKSVSRFTVYSKHGGGLHVEVRPDGLKRFNYRARLNGKQFDYQIGSYPAMTLAAARLAHAEAVALVKQGIDPRQAAKQVKTKNLEMLSQIAKILDMKVEDVIGLNRQKFIINGFVKVADTTYEVQNKEDVENLLKRINDMEVGYASISK